MANSMQQMLCRMGFNDRFIRWIMMCVPSVKYFVVNNNNKVGPITASRGLRQGDPLSPYIFILCAEGFSAILRRGERLGRLHGCRISRSHLFFADDSLLFFRANQQEGNVVKGCIIEYEEALGQLINYNKSEAFFSSNTATNAMTEVCELLGVNLSNGRDNICDDLGKMLNGYWWGDTENRKKIHSAAWDKLCVPKYKGGMGFRKLKEFNISTLGKHLRRLIENPDSLLGRVLKARCFPRHGILDAGKVGNQSSFWSGLVAAKDRLKTDFRQHIGDGRETLIYGNWWPSVDKLHPISCRDDRFCDATVLELFFEGAHVWNEAVVRAVFNEKEAEQLLSIRLARSSREGALFWYPERKALSLYAQHISFCVKAPLMCRQTRWDGWDNAPNARDECRDDGDDALNARDDAGHACRCGGGGGSRQGSPKLPGDNVYHPYMDLLSSDSPQSTPLETQFPDIETFSFEELGLSPVRVSY
ncbi:uncharacterized protein LOC121776939 [Salvia splendens]|uniref:uncharacterized protein LOC121776939 n=1 Tax=Salvia splendens TaxID=180675 RepID=UPI001C255DE2|nr:uncharacterized protein LOC121776939 [Salvia splendens]